MQLSACYTFNDAYITALAAHLRGADVEGRRDTHGFNNEMTAPPRNCITCSLIHRRRRQSQQRPGVLAIKQTR